ALRSSFSARLDNELRAAVTTTRRELIRDDSIPFTAIADQALLFGDEAQDYTAQQTFVRISDAVHLRTGAHTFKLGGAFTLGSYEYDTPPAPRGAYAFADVDQLIAGVGSFVRIEGPASFADWSNRTITLFAQDRWYAG